MKLTELTVCIARMSYDNVRVKNKNNVNRIVTQIVYKKNEPFRTSNHFNFAFDI